ncbi:hypothetical protein EPR50_G00019010 [Perca flavescens]|uniref:Uncharacterized protein n=1 Tax=Perca flavescens TaxID=8167 RepID=A0A484DMA4_PERFV|nr:hypothetical protein EPR50_G00019010 [Perca flavescens]
MAGQQLASEESRRPTTGGSSTQKDLFCQDNNRTICACTLLIEHPSECEEGKRQEREHDRQHLQLSEWRCHLHPLPQL